MIVFVRWTTAEGDTDFAHLPSRSAAALRVRDLLNEGATDITIRQD